MAAGLLAEPAFKAAFDEVAALLDEGLDRPLREVVWPAAGTPTPLDDTRYTQPALFAIEYALSALWRSWGVKPAAVAGHSIGEITAAVVAGVLSLPDAARLVVARARLMSALPAGGVMLAVRCDEQTARRFITPYPDTVSLAAVNSPNDVVVAGAADDVAAVQQAMAAEGIAGTLLTVSHAFHSPLMRPMVDEFRRVLDGLTFHAPRVPIVSNVTGTWWTPADAGPQYWIDHALGAVRFLDGVRTLHADGFRTFLELGPQPVLSTLGARCVDDEQAVFTASLRRGGDRQQLPRALATLHLRGAAIDWAAVHAGRDVRRVALPTTPWHGESYWFREAAPVAAVAAAPAGETVLTDPVTVLRVPGAHPVYQLRPRPTARTWRCRSARWPGSRWSWPATGTAAGAPCWRSWWCTSSSARPSWPGARR
ncbi:acyltransferase domain-containing protein [Catellatospora bangladeshensis]|uniref:acyltransferase domain-containing protein n=1 Tax=Catellatospora bangladeshensis TaxID=310355 RepID=UPI00360FF4F5